MNIQTDQKAILIGLTGGIGSGKSTVADMFTTSGFTVLSADTVASALMETNTEIQAELLKTFSERVLTEDGKINKAFLAERVFGVTSEHHSELNKLNNIVHPFVLDELLSQAEDLAINGEKCIILEIPLLYEIGLEDAFDYVILVITTDKIRIERVKRRSNLSDEHIKARIAEQVSSEQIKGYADFVIENNGTIDTLQQSVNFLVDILPHLPPASMEDEDFTHLEDEDSK